MHQHNHKVPISIMQQVNKFVTEIAQRKKTDSTHKKKDIFRFTLYWTLIFHTPIFFFCGLYAFWNYVFPPSPRPPSPLQTLDSSYQLSPMAPKSAVSLIRPSRLHKPKERRSRLAFAVIVLMTFVVLSVAGAVMSSAILGFIAAGLYKVADFNMSTCVIHATYLLYTCLTLNILSWVPFLLAVLQVVIGLLRWEDNNSHISPGGQYSSCMPFRSVWPSIIEIIWMFTWI